MLSGLPSSFSGVDIIFTGSLPWYLADMKMAWPWFSFFYPDGFLDQRDKERRIDFPFPFPGILSFLQPPLGMAVEKRIDYCHFPVHAFPGPQFPCAHPYSGPACRGFIRKITAFPLAGVVHLLFLLHFFFLFIPLFFPVSAGPIAPSHLFPMPLLCRET